LGNRQRVELNRFAVGTDELPLDFVEHPPFRPTILLLHRQGPLRHRLAPGLKTLRVFIDRHDQSLMTLHYPFPKLEADGRSVGIVIRQDYVRVAEVGEHMHLVRGAGAPPAMSHSASAVVSADKEAVAVPLATLEVVGFTLPDDGGRFCVEQSVVAKRDAKLHQIPHRRVSEAIRQALDGLGEDIVAARSVGAVHVARCQVRRVRIEFVCWFSVNGTNGVAL